MSDEEVDKYDLQLYSDNILHRIRYIKKFYGFTISREQFLNEWNIIRDDKKSISTYEQGIEYGCTWCMNELGDLYFLFGVVFIS